MDDSGFKGLTGLLGLLGCAVLFFLLRRLAPSFARGLLIAGAVLLALLLVLVGVVLFLSLRRDKERAKDPEASEHDAQLARGRALLLELKKHAIRVRNPQIRTLCGEIDAIGSAILRALREHPAQIASMRQFFTYYLPTLVTILKKYAMLEKSGSCIDTLSASAAECLTSARDALRRMHESIFDAELLDLSVEMDVLLTICRRDGLLTDDDLSNSGLLR